MGQHRVNLVPRALFQSQGKAPWGRGWASGQFRLRSRRETKKTIILTCCDSLITVVFFFYIALVVLFFVSTVWSLDRNVRARMLSAVHVTE